MELSEKLLQEIVIDLRDGLTIMDEGGRANNEDNSGMLWFKDWYHLRDLLLKNHDRLKEILFANRVPMQPVPAPDSTTGAID